MRSSYRKEDVRFLLTDITGKVTPQPADERERQIQAGRHYSEMLPIEYVPGLRYMEAYEEALKHNAALTAHAVGRLSDKIMEQKGNDTVLVSLARAGTPVGILIRRYIAKKYRVLLPHYSISIIRGRGIDDAAMRYLLGKFSPKQLLFVDGWIGKGAIFRELKKDMEGYPGVSADLAVLADPANMTKLCGTHEDLLIPSSCLNATVSGLVSRTFYRDDVIAEGEFHGAAYYGELADSDVSYAFIEAVEKEFVMVNPPQKPAAAGFGIREAEEIAAHFAVSDINFIKPGIGEATRVLLRRIPWKVLIVEKGEEDPSLAHLLRLAEEKNVPVEYYPLAHYKACGIIKKLADT